jgi:hypothetical protein
VENLALSGWGITGGDGDANKSALVQVNAGGVRVGDNAIFIMEGGVGDTTANWE